MKILYLVFAVLLLVSLATPGYGQKKRCPWRCDKTCLKSETSVKGYYCPKYPLCCRPPKKGK